VRGCCCAMVDRVTDIANNTTTNAADRYVALSIVLTRYIELMTFSALNKREQAHAVNVNFGNAVSVAARQVPSTGDGFGSSTSDIASQNNCASC
jgi:hypothetical protein